VCTPEIEGGSFVFSFSFAPSPFLFTNYQELNMPYTTGNLEGTQVTMMDGNVHAIQKPNSNTECKECGRVAFLVDGYCSIMCEERKEERSTNQHLREAF